MMKFGSSRDFCRMKSKEPKTETQQERGLLSGRVELSNQASNVGRSKVRQEKTKLMGLQKKQ